jgi:membrane protein YdbS with pleckstrin-like domain
VLTLDVGPVISLSFWVFFGWIVGAVAAVCVFAAAIVWFCAADRAWSVVPAGATVVMAQGAGMLAARPWKKRHLGRWPMAWLIGRGVSFLGVFAAGALLYSTTRPDPLVFGLVTAGAYFVSLLAEVWAYSLQVKESTGGDVSLGVSSSESGG